MPRTADMFAELKPPRQAPRKLMHVSDAGDPDRWGIPGDGAMCVMTCRHCGHESDWLHFETVTEAKRGLPCPACTAAPLQPLAGGEDHDR